MIPMNIERLEEWAKEVHSFYMYAGVDPAEHKTGGYYHHEMGRVRTAYRRTAEADH